MDFDDNESKIDLRTSQIIEVEQKSINSVDESLDIMMQQKSLSVETFSKYSHFGRFILHDMN